MCLGSGVAPPKPEETLADMMRDDLGAHVDKNALRLFIKHRWAEIAPLAHAIHGSTPPVEDKKNG